MQRYRRGGQIVIVEEGWEGIRRNGRFCRRPASRDFRVSPKSPGDSQPIDKRPEALPVSPVGPTTPPASESGERCEAWMCASINVSPRLLHLIFPFERGARTTTGRL
jgi:hypothetical protein